MLNPLIAWFDPVQVNVMIVVSVCSCVSVVMVSGYACLTLTYGENDNEVFHHHNNLEVVIPDPTTNDQHNDLFHTQPQVWSVCQLVSVTKDLVWYIQPGLTAFCIILYVNPRQSILAKLNGRKNQRFDRWLNCKYHR